MAADGEQADLTEAELEQQRQALSGGTGAEIFLTGDKTIRTVVDCDRATVRGGFLQFRDEAGELVKVFSQERVMVIDPIGSFSMPSPDE